MELDKGQLIFRPQEFSGKFKLKNNPVGKYHRYARQSADLHYVRVGGYLHYLADHAPLPVRKKWKTAFQHFLKLHPKF